MAQYLKLLKDFLAAVRAGEWVKAWKLSIQIQELIASLLVAGEVVAMSVEEKAELAAVRGDIESSLKAAETGASAIGDGKIVAWLIKIGLIVIGIPLPFESE